MDVTLNGYRIAYQERGVPQAPALVFLHGFPFSQAMWHEQAGLCEQSFRVVTYDQRGHGRSDAGDGQYTIEFLVDDLVALLDHLKIGQAILCGLSMGGYVALRAVERHPERVRALVLCDTRSEPDSNEAKLKRATHIRLVKEKGVAAFAEGFLKAVFAPESFTKHSQAVARIRQTIESNPPLGVCGTLLALAGRTDTTPALAAIHVPTLILVGEKDMVTPPAAAEALHKQIVGSRLEVLSGAGHLSNLENPEAFNRALLTFLNSLSRV